MFLMTFGSIILAILAFIFVLGSIILIHEGGHFYFAHKCGVLCREYAFGMGPRLIGKKKGETTYAINAFPIGGYVAIAGEEKEADPLKGVEKVRLVIEDEIVKKICFEVDNVLFSDLPLFDLVAYDLYDEAQTGELYIDVKEEDNVKRYKVDDKAEYIYATYKKREVDLNKKEKYISSLQIAPYNRQLNSKKIGQRAMVMFGGPMMNFVLAIVVFIISAFIMGVSNTKSTVLSSVSEGTPAYIAGLDEGDKILSLHANGESELLVETKTWSDISSFMEQYENGNYNDVITIRYLDDETDSQKEVNIRPMVLIYSISMYEDISSDEVKIAALAKKSKAYLAGLREGDIITKVNGNEINTWKDVYSEFKKIEEAKQKVTVCVNREGEAEELSFEVTPYSKKLFERTQNVSYVAMQIGISPTNTRNPLLCLKAAFVNMYSCVKQLAVTLWMLITSSEVGIRDLSGVVGIFSLTSDAASNGFGYLLYWMGFLSVNVGFMNLLPIPALDGGRLMFLLIEAIRKKPVSQKIQDLSINITMILLFALMGFTIINDILRFF
ncbi:MAG: RIP metalloprotease RseP [Bacilli bacterium]|nr:RIP metalloprotease RseP [Bacilli bacterium]